MRKGDGTYTTTCRNHGGGHQLRAPGDPKNGGRPVAHGIHARHLPADFQLDYDDGIGDVDEQLRIKRAFLFRATRMAAENPSGGIQVSVKTGNGERSVAIRPWISVVSELSDQIRKLRLAKHTLEQAGPVDEQDLMGHEEWLKAAQSRGRRRRSS